MIVSELTDNIISWMTKLEKDSAKIETVNQPIERQLHKPGPDIFTNFVNRVEGFGTWVENNIADMPKDQIGKRNPCDGPSSITTDDNGMNKHLKHQSTFKSFIVESKPCDLDAPSTSGYNKNRIQVKKKNLFKGFMNTTVGITGKAVSKMMKMVGKPFEKPPALTYPGATVAPWDGYPDQEKLKLRCLSLSSDKRTFLRNPPRAVDFPFDYQQSYPKALAAMEQDPKLVKMQHRLVPKVLPEEVFWRNYFYRVSLICDIDALTLKDGAGISRFTRYSEVFEDDCPEKEETDEGNAAINADAVEESN